MSARVVVVIGEKEEDDMGFRGDHLHSPEALYPMEGASPLEPLELLKYYL